MDNTSSYPSARENNEQRADIGKPVAKDVKNLSHYTQFKMQPIEFFMANIGCLDFLQMCVIKYICRYKMKNGIEDLDKAQRYIEYCREQWHREHPSATLSKPSDPIPGTECRLIRDSGGIEAHHIDCLCRDCRPLGLKRQPSMDCSSECTGRCGACSPLPKIKY